VTPRGPYAKGRERRREILRAALEAYSEAGVRGVPLKEIATRAGVTEAGLLHHFGSKEALLSEVLHARDAATAEALGDLLDRNHVRDLARHNTTTPGLVRLFVDVVAAASSPDHPAHDGWRERYRRICALNETGFEREVAAAARPQAPPADEPAPNGPAPDEPAPNGTCADGRLDDTAWMSRILVAAMDGLQLQWLLDEVVDMAADIARLHSALVAVGARARRTPPPAEH